MTLAAAASVKNLLGEQSMADIASGADDMRSAPEYEKTGPWHFVDLPLGYSNAQFSDEIKKQGADNVIFRSWQLVTSIIGEINITKRRTRAILQIPRIHQFGKGWHKFEIGIDGSP